MRNFHEAMGDWARIKIPRRSARRIRSAGPFVAALTFHLVILSCAVQWRPPIVVKAPVAEQVSLFAAPGRVAIEKNTRLLSLPQNAPLVEATRRPRSVISPVAASLVLKVRPPFDPPPDLQPISISEVESGAPPEAEPVLSALIPSSAANAMPELSTTGGGKTCQLFDQIKSILQTSDQVHHALPLIPSSARSVANAVMLWDGHWITAQAMGGPRAFDPIQAVVLQAIKAAPATCQTELVRGPRLIAIGGTGDTTVLAFGSGEWRWGDLLVPPS